MQRHMAAKDHQYTETEDSSDNLPSVLTKKAGEKTIKRPKRRWKSGKVDIAGYAEVPEKPAVKLNNFFKLDEPSATDLVDKVCEPPFDNIMEFKPQFHCFRFD